MSAVALMLAIAALAVAVTRPALRTKTVTIVEKGLRGPTGPVGRPGKFIVAPETKHVQEIAVLRHDVNTLAAQVYCGGRPGCSVPCSVLLGYCR